MNCKDFESIIHEIVSQRTADSTRQLEALEHASHCLWCALRLEEETKLTESMQALARTLSLQHAPVRVEDALVQAFRERTPPTATRRIGLTAKRLWRRLSWGLVFSATVAAAWMLVLQVSHWHRSSGLLPRPVAGNAKPVAPDSRNQQEQPFLPGQGQRGQPQTTAGRSIVPGTQNSHVTNPGASVLNHHWPGSGPQAESHGRVERAALEEYANEATTDFIPLGTCDDSECMAEAVLVRVSLPAEALLAFGLPMDSDYSTEQHVQADVALGSDGVPLAIRFLN